MHAITTTLEAGEEEGELLRKLVGSQFEATPGKKFIRLPSQTINQEW
jgi:hypothetical protein